MAGFPDQDDTSFGLHGSSRPSLGVNVAGVWHFRKKLGLGVANGRADGVSLLRGIDPR
jgi:hypothetical protein